MKYLIISFLFSWVISCNQEKNNSQLGPPVLPAEQLHAAFLIVDGVYNSELVAPMDVLQHTIFHSEKGIKVFTVSNQNEPITTLSRLLFIALHISMVSNVPAAPTKIPPVSIALLLYKNPPQAAATPVKEFSKEITTGISAPPIGSTKEIP